MVILMAEASSNSSDIRNITAVSDKGGDSKSSSVNKSTAQWQTFKGTINRQ